MDEVKGSEVVDIGVDLTEFYTSVEWDILEVPAVRYRRFICNEKATVTLVDQVFCFTGERVILFSFFVAPSECPPLNQR